MGKIALAMLFMLTQFGGIALAQDTVKIAYIDTLSGGGASVGVAGLKAFQFLAEDVNAKGGILDKNLEIVPMDNKTNAQESVIQAQKAIDSGIRFIMQENGSSVAVALTEFVLKHNERNPGEEVLYFGYTFAGRPIAHDGEVDRTGSAAGR